MCTTILKKCEEKKEEKEIVAVAYDAKMFIICNDINNDAHAKVAI